jgi:hypothetical protein
MEEMVPQVEGLGVHLAAQPLITIFDVKYLHLRMEDGTDLYVTEHGLHSTKCLLPHNHWRDKDWRERHSVRLPGTSALYRVTTKEVDGHSRDLVIKWNRMGQDIPGETTADAAGAEFNSPFMEFSLVLELRRARHESPGRLFTHKPLAIYVPRKFVEAESLGRRPDKMEAIQRSHHEEIELHWNRNYAVIYEWLKGIDATQACREGLLHRDEMAALLEQANRELDRMGFRIRDHKPQHVIVRPAPRGGLIRDKSGASLYGLVDFELLERTPTREQAVRASKRRDYLIRQARRFETREELPPGLTLTTIMDVDYIYGQVESTGGALWVVGRDPVLFDYFLPEKWRRTPRTRLSASQAVYRTMTKDNVHLVWRLSRVGQRPEADPFVRAEKQILAYGFNSPFEEFSIALDLAGKGIGTTYPRAIYMTGRSSTVSSSLADRSRYLSHAELRTPEGFPVLQGHREYLTIWGYWNGPDEVLADKDEGIYRGLDALSAYSQNRLTQREYFRVMRATKRRLAAAGFEALSLRGHHLLLSIDGSQKIVTDQNGLPLVRICNFELLKRMTHG